MAIDTGIGISLDLVSTSDEGAQAPLGQTLLKPAGTDGKGEQVWIYIQAGENLSAKDVCARDVSVSGGFLNSVVKVPASSAASRVVGIAQHAIPSGSYGWVLKCGTTSLDILVATGATEAAGDALVVSGTAGTPAAAAAVTDSAFGFITEECDNSAGVTPVLFTNIACVVDCRG